MTIEKNQFAMTKARAAVLDYVRGYPATASEIQAAMGMSCHQRVGFVMRWLQDFGLVRIAGHGARRLPGGVLPMTYQATPIGEAVLDVLRDRPAFTTTAQRINVTFAEVENVLRQRQEAA